MNSWPSHFGKRKNITTINPFNSRIKRNPFYYNRQAMCIDEQILPFHNIWISNKNQKDSSYPSMLFFGQQNPCYTRPAHRMSQLSSDHFPTCYTYLLFSSCFQFHKLILNGHCSCLNTNIYSNENKRSFIFISNCIK